MSPPTYKRKYDDRDYRDDKKKGGSNATRRWGGSKKRKGGKKDDKKRRGGKTKRRRIYQRISANFAVCSSVSVSGNATLNSMMRFPTFPSLIIPKLGIVFL